MKRIHTLYRVSTKKQVDKEKNDIPMQRLACKEFAEQQGRVITREFEAKGVSGAEMRLRDALVSIPMTGDAESLNVASAATACLFASQTVRGMTL